MFNDNSFSHRRITTVVVYLAVIAAALSISTLRLRAQSGAVEATSPESASTVTDKPYFSLSTNRTYGTADRARVWINYLGIDQMDFRVYRVADPVKFFKSLEDPHQMGDGEKTQIIAGLKKEPSALEKVRSFKVSIFKSIRDYFRNQLRRGTRESLNQKLNREGDRQPLNVADYARVPLLNPDQMVSSWREKLTPLDNVYDTRMVMLGKRDPGVYLVEAVNGDLRAYTIAIVTDLTMINKTAPTGEILVYAADRKSGAPREGVKVEVIKAKETVAKGTTDKSGLLRTRVERPKPKPSTEENSEDVDPESEAVRDENSSYLVTAQDRDHFAISDLAAYYFGAYGGEGEEGESEGGGGLTSYIYTDRPVYRPAQKVFFRGILRIAGDRGYELPSGSVSTVIEDPDGGKLLETELKLTARGAFSGSVDIAPGAPLGQYRIVATAGAASASEYFEIQEYKKPEYKVTVTTPKKFVEAGQKTKFSIEARYFFGEPVKEADVTYYIYRSRYYPWWWADEDEAEASESESEGDGDYGYGNDMVKDGEAVLNADGKLDIEFEVPAADEKDSADYTYRLEAQVTDKSRRTIEAKTSFVGTRGNVVANTSTDRYVYYEGDTARIKVSTTDYEGRPLAAGVTLKFVERRWDATPKQDETGRTRNEYTLRERELASADVTTNQQGEASYDYAVTGPGSINVKTIVKDGNKQYASNEDYLWVADRKDAWSDWSSGDSQSIKLVADKKSYQPGETAHVLAMLPTDKAHLLVTTELTGVMTARIVDSPSRAVMIDVPIEARYSPNVYLNVAYIQDGEMYTHDRFLSVPAKSKFLDIEVLADKKEYKPRETAKYTILARNSDGSPAPGAELSLGVVDEAIYSVRPDATRDIRKVFYGRRYNQVQTSFTISYYFKGHSGDKPLNIAANKRSYQLADFKNEAQYAEPTIRKDFKDTTFWQPDIVTGADGKAIVDVKLPDNLTTWRATVRGVTADTRVGSAILKFVARKNLILRLETPRFLTEGDTVTLSAIVHNYLDAAKAVKISIDVTGARLLNASSQTVTIPKQGEHRIDWRVAANQVGEVKLLAKALTDQESDGVEIPLEVIPHGLKQTTGGAVTLTGDSDEKTIALNLPADAHAQARALRIEASPSVAGTLFGALDYLTAYPYGCTEQTMSSFLPNVIVAQALKDVKTASIRGTNDLATKVQRGMDRLYGFQHGDGGWGWWKDDKTDPFMTAYVIDGLSLASRAGYTVDKQRISNGREKLMQMIASGKGDDTQPIDPETRAYMVYALGQSGAVDASVLNDLFARRAQLQGYGRALLALALKQQRDDNRARQVAGEIEQAARTNEYDTHWESKHTSHGYQVENDTEATALSLKALARINPQSGLLSKAAKWLVANRRNGYYWESTRQTAFAIFGLIDYVRISKELSPDYSVQVFLNGEQVISKQVTAADVASAQAFLIERKGAQLGGSNQIRVVKTGKGALYFSTSLSYFTRDEEIQAQASPNLTLTREYLRLRVVESGEQARWEIQPLSGEIRSGDLLVSRLKVKGSTAKYLMIEDPIPAGCEQVERISGLDLTYGEGSNRWSDWYSSREFRDQKTALFMDYFDGDATFQVALRVQVPGEFRVAPARAELMYQPTVQSNTAGARISFLDKK
ncbi:MAG TPA: MG2 domain-containing protein [Blastocatellia bacterium]|nr:MG2 domain-containing protein [Blastocatellia bacterium]